MRSPVARYRIEAPLRQTSAGDLFRAIDSDTGRPIALKLQRPDDGASPAERLRGARACAAVHHASLPTIYEVGEADGTVFVALELVTGPTMRERVASDAIPTSTKLEWLQDLAGALEVMHQGGLVHRDLTPDHVVVDRDGKARFMDFGLAERSLSNDGAQPATALAGTPRYMAPEQRLGLATAASDQHAWGTLAYEVVAGHHPDERTATAPRLSELAPGLPDEWESVIARARSEDAARRFATMTDLRSALGLVAESLTTIATPAKFDEGADLVTEIRLPGEGKPDAPDADDEAATLEPVLQPVLAPSLAPSPAGALPSKAPVQASPLRVRGRGEVPQVGEILDGRYQLTGVLGRGTMGEVFAGEHLLLKRPVAIKFLRSTGAEAIHDRFAREALVTSELSSRHATRVFDVATPKNRAPYIVMELLTGQDLEAVLQQRGPLPLREAVHHVLEACDALAEAHALGVVHRDLKPGNIFLATAADGSRFAKVVDFGLSKITDERRIAVGSDISQTNMIMGSPAYMSPEQIRSTKKVDARADVWSLGVVLYELLTAALPFDGATPATVFLAVTTEAYVPIRTRNPGLPEELDALFARCFAKDLTERLPSIQEFALALRAFVGPEEAPLLESIASRGKPAALPTMPSTPPTSRVDRPRPPAHGGASRGPAARASRAKAPRRTPKPGDKGSRAEALVQSLRRLPPRVLAVVGAGALVVLLALFFALRPSREVVPPATSDDAPASTTPTTPTPPTAPPTATSPTPPATAPTSAVAIPPVVAPIVPPVASSPAPNAPGEVRGTPPGRPKVQRPRPSALPNRP